MVSRVADRTLLQAAGADRVSFGLAAWGAGRWIVFFIGLYHLAITWPQWSLYVLFPCLVLASALLLLNRRARLKARSESAFTFEKSGPLRFRIPIQKRRPSGPPQRPSKKPVF
jgi:hypothetical protein